MVNASTNDTSTEPVTEVPFSYTKAPAQNPLRSFNPHYLSTRSCIHGKDLRSIRDIIRK